MSFTASLHKNTDWWKLLLNFWQAKYTDVKIQKSAWRVKPLRYSNAITLQYSTKIKVDTIRWWRYARGFTSFRSFHSAVGTWFGSAIIDLYYKLTLNLSMYLQPTSCRLLKMGRIEMLRLFFLFDKWTLACRRYTNRYSPLIRSVSLYLSSTDLPPEFVKFTSFQDDLKSAHDTNHIKYKKKKMLGKYVYCTLICTYVYCLSLFLNINHILTAFLRTIQWHMFRFFRIILRLDAR